jgi:predicted transcriptional regulator
VMSAEVITVTEETPVREIAELLETRRVKRVPVTRDGTVVGIVSRANLLHAVAAQSNHPDAPPEDAAIRDSILSQLRQEPWASDITINVTVEDGVVSYWGLIGSPTQRDALRVLAEATPGVRDVRNHLTMFDPRQPARG